MTGDDGVCVAHHCIVLCYYDTIWWTDSWNRRGGHLSICSNVILFYLNDKVERKKKKKLRTALFSENNIISFYAIKELSMKMYIHVTYVGMTCLWVITDINGIWLDETQTFQFCSGFFFMYMSNYTHTRRADIFIFILFHLHDFNFLFVSKKKQTKS